MLKNRKTPSEDISPHCALLLEKEMWHQNEWRKNDIYNSNTVQGQQIIWERWKSFSQKSVNVCPTFFFISAVSYTTFLNLSVKVAIHVSLFNSVKEKRNVKCPDWLLSIPVVWHFCYKACLSTLTTIFPIEFLGGNVKSHFDTLQCGNLVEVFILFNFHIHLD